MLKDYWKLFSNKFVAEAKMQCLLEEKVASILFFSNIFFSKLSFFQDFMNSNVVTTVDTMTASLSEVYFPSAVVCNINQVS